MRVQISKKQTYQQNQTDHGDNDDDYDDDDDKYEKKFKSQGKNFVREERGRQSYRYRDVEEIDSTRRTDG